MENLLVLTVIGKDRTGLISSLSKQIADHVGIMKQGRLVAIRKRSDFKHADLEEIYMREMQVPQAKRSQDG